MKKIFLTLVLFFGISVSSSINAYADEIATDESVSETISNESLSDEVIDSLTIDDFVRAYEISSSDEAFKDLSEDDQNLYMIKLYNEIYESKSYRVTARYLPSAYENLNSAEKKLVKSYPAQAAQVYTASSLATKRTNALYKNGLHNGNGDAFRHTYWNAEMATMLAGYGSSFNPSNGKTNAKRWADAHEENKNQPANEKQMDLFNNNVGWSIVNKKYSSKDLEKKALAKVDAGSCRRIVNNKVVATTKAR